MEIKSQADIITYSHQNTAELTELIINHFHKTSEMLEKVPEEFHTDIAHAQLGSYIKASAHAFASFVSILIDGQPDESYGALRGQFMGMVGTMLDESRKMAKEIPNEMST